MKQDNQLAHDLANKLFEDMNRLVEEKLALAALAGMEGYDSVTMICEAIEKLIMHTAVARGRGKTGVKILAGTMAMFISEGVKELLATLEDDPGFGELLAELEKLQKESRV